jgi:putative colanic acid biosynthesis glycosyltransferase
MKVALIDVVYGHGSTGKIVEVTHRHLIKYGYESRAYFGRGPVKSTPHVKKISTNLEVFIDAGLSRATGYTGIFSPLATARLIAELEEFQPDVIHVHELHGYYVNYFKLVEYFKVKDIPIVWSLHCEQTYTGRCGNALDCDQWKTQCVKCPRLNDYPASWKFDRAQEQFERKKMIFEDMNRIVFAPVSNWLLSRFRQSFLKDRPARVVHNGIDTAKTFYPRQAHDLRERYGLVGRYVIVSAAQDLMTSIKGGQWVIDLAARLQDKPISFLMIGIQSSIQVPPNVITLPAMANQSDLAVHYSLADLFLTTSQAETFSLVCAESLACGTPVVGYDSGGPSEVAPEPYGRFVPYGDLAALETVVVSIQEGRTHVPDEQDCVNYARAGFSNEQMLQGFLSLYQEMTTEKSQI